MLKKLHVDLSERAGPRPRQHVTVHGMVIFISTVVIAIVAIVLGRRRRKSQS